MLLVLTNIIFFPSVFFSKRIFKKWVNPLSVYSFIWYCMIIFFSFRLIKYDEISTETWIVIFFVHLSLYLGSFTYYSVKLLGFKGKELKKNNFEIFLADDGKLSFFLTLVLGAIGLIGAIQAWTVLVQIYGTVINALLHLGALYQMRVQGELTDIWPYTSIFSYSSIFFAAVYSAVKSRLTLVSALPLFALVIKEIAVAGRAGILFGFVEFIFTFLFVLFFITKNYPEKRIKKIPLITSIAFTIIFFLISVTIVKNLRVGNEEFRGQTRVLKQLERDSFISPSIYLYASGHIGVLNKFLEKENEHYRIGENSFQFVYNILSKFNITERPDTYQKPYFIPTWINTGTFIRELIADFGLPITFLIVFLLGFQSTLSWNYFFDRKNLYYLVQLVFLMIIIFFSFLMMITRLANWFLSPLFILLVIYFVNKFDTKIKLLLNISSVNNA